MPSNLSLQAKYPHVTPEELEKLSNSKLCSIMVIDNPNAIAYLHSKNPNRIYVYRKVAVNGIPLEHYLDMEVGLSNPQTLANKWFNALKADILALPLGTYVQIVNEYNNQDRLAEFGQFEVACAALVNAIGRFVVGGNFADGNPQDVNKFANYMPTVRHFAKTGNATGLHEYNGTSLYHARTLEWNLFRHRILARLYDFASITNLKIFITETGITDIEGSNTPGWTQCPNYGRDAYLADLKKYSEDLNSDSYVKAAFIYLLCHQVDSGPPERIQDFDISPLLNDLLVFIASKNTGVQLPLPTPAPTPVPTGYILRNTTGLNLRRGPGYDYDVLTIVRSGDSFSVVTENPPLGLVDNWVEVVKGNYRGWCYARYIAKA